MHYAENECAMPIRLHCNELRALCLTTIALCRTAEISALLVKCVLIVCIWPEKGVMEVKTQSKKSETDILYSCAGCHFLFAFVIKRQI